MVILPTVASHVEAKIKLQLPASGSGRLSVFEGSGGPEDGVFLGTFGHCRHTSVYKRFIQHIKFSVEVTSLESCSMFSRAVFI